MFALKTIDFFGRRLKVLLQNENGPCPLLALSNILILENKISISSDMMYITMDQLTSLIAGLILEGASSACRGQEFQLNTVLETLPKLIYGMDVNIGFESVTSMEFTSELSVFDIVNTPVMHGWVVDKCDTHTAEVMARLTYNQAINELVEFKSIIDSLSEVSDILNDIVSNVILMNSHDTETTNENIYGNSDSNSNKTENVLQRGRIIDSFLDDSKGQITYTGLLQLHEELKERQLVVFYRNAHFSTLFKLDGRLFVLVTDEGYRDVDNVCWELLDEIDGDTEYMDSSFTPTALSMFNLLPPAVPVQNANIGLPISNTVPTGTTVAVVPDRVEKHGTYTQKSSIKEVVDDATFARQLRLDDENELRLEQEEADRRTALAMHDEDVRNVNSQYRKNAASGVKSSRSSSKKDESSCSIS